MVSGCLLQHALTRTKNEFEYFYYFIYIGLQYAIETFDNYGRQNNLANIRPLNGWLPEDDKNAGNGIQSNWQLSTFNSDGVLTYTGDYQYLRSGGTTTTYACDGFGGGSQLINGKVGIYSNFK